MGRTYDLRSDTVTRPTPAMRAAMAQAEVGDDAYGDDPTVCELERRVARITGFEAAVFVPSGTMANQLAVRLHTSPGETIAAPPGAHVQIHEDGSAAGLSGAQIMPLGTVHGYDADALESLLHEETCGWPRVGLVWLENTLGVAGGRVWPLEAQQAIATVARRHGRPVHLDGARLWNAHVATGTPLTALTELADTASVALSKGLGAPMGSLLCGTEAIVRRARGFKHAFGGGFRQAGILAAAGLHALDHHVERLADDHRRARRLADGLADLRCWTMQRPTTNIVIADVNPPWSAAEDLCCRIRNAGVLCYPNVYRQVRLVTHLGIGDDDIPEIIARIRGALSD